MNIRDPSNTCTFVAALSLGLFALAASAANKAGGCKCDARAAIAASQAVAPGGIDELVAVEIGGIKQWISVRGNDPKNPILLFLHGGPGSPMMAESWTFQRPWEDFFTVVQWDQRGSGKTFSAAKRKVDRSMSIDRMQADAEQLIQLLRQKYSKNKIFLLGHSWGSILGVRVAQHRPEWLYAYIAVGQVVNMRRNEAVGYELTLAQATALNNQSAVKELKSIAPYPEADSSIPQSKTRVERKWDVAFGGMLYGLKDDNEWQRWNMSPDYSDYDVRSAQLGEASSVEVLWPQLAAVSFDGVSRFECPVFVFAGAHDRTTPTSLAEEFYNRIQAPEKKFFKIERASHYVFNESPGEVLVDLVRDVRPLYEHDRTR
jgi:pimeloyl-ACP methyl ester carboxylesterase